MPAPAPALQSNEAQKPTGKKKKKVVVILASWSCSSSPARSSSSKTSKTVYRPGQPVPAGPVVSLGTVTVALSDGHLVQATIALQMTKPAS